MILILHIFSLISKRRCQTVTGYVIIDVAFAFFQLIHDTVVDTSILFPHRLGPPNKRALRSLMADYLMRIHQGDGKSMGFY